MSILMAASSSSVPTAVNLIITVSPVQASAVINGGGTAYTNYVTASCSNGVGPFTAVWSFDSGTDNDFTISAPTSVTTRFSNTLTINQSKGGYYKVTMTDSLGNTGTKVISVTAIDITFDGGIPY